ncbi:uncharacterized protein CXQ87_000245 [Candidozyma duobushaemuli]|uniref:Uncharacterized protein n=1 Tax=Candidozyma duobushaemuli TaxID=1231522 RepID=A0A2V1AH30_9ASCO|nr:uncharacterized protein CXQ87_000245 [[Candida] duobushaemulonis]PVH17360.1 hypothetical protein CXQ87_000245 [[Candida] duobushaemulonis]
MSLHTVAIVIGTMVCGCLNSLLTKYQDNQCVKNCSNPDVNTHQNFEQPAIQTLQMFIGEFGIYIVYYVIYKSPFSRRAEYQPLTGETRPSSKSQSMLLAIPSVCDMLATTFMNVGLIYTPVSIYQMTRGAIVLFVAVLSVVFLHRRIRPLEWIALVIVTLGIGIVGYSEVEQEPALVIFGMSLIIVAVSLQAVQFVVEEKILAKYHFTPLRLVYTEGFFGVTILTTSLVALNFIIGSIQSKDNFADSPFNLRESLTQTFSSREVLISSFLIMICISSFNFCGVSLTQKLSATARSTIDSCRTLLVWITAMVLGWESFSSLQLFGFVTLLFGTLCFNGVLQPEDWSIIPDFLKDKAHKNERLIDVVDEPVERM